MATYAQSVRTLQPIISQLFAALDKGVEGATEIHTERRFLRQHDPHYFAHTVRRIAHDRLLEQGLQASLDSGRPVFGLSGLLVLYGGTAVRILRPDTEPRTGGIPLPGHSRERQKFWAQDAIGVLPGLETDNLLLLWEDAGGKIVDPMRLVRPTGGDHRRDSLTYDWYGKLARAMATLGAEDLDKLRPDAEGGTMGELEP